MTVGGHQIDESAATNDEGSDGHDANGEHGNEDGGQGDPTADPSREMRSHASTTSSRAAR